LVPYISRCLWQKRGGWAKTGFLWVKDFGMWAWCWGQTVGAGAGVEVDSRVAMATMVGWCRVLGAEHCGSGQGSEVESACKRC